MNRREFLEELRKNLSKLPADEVDAAVEFYEEYFDEALDECETDEEREAREKELIEEAGRPAAIAARIGESMRRVFSKTMRRLPAAAARRTGCPPCGGLFLGCVRHLFPCPLRLRRLPLLSVCWRLL